MGYYKNKMLDATEKPYNTSETLDSNWKDWFT